MSSFFGFQVAQQAVKGGLVGVVVLPSRKSGTKYSRTSTARSLPVSASKHSQSLSISMSTSRMGKSLRRLVAGLRFARPADFGLHPLTADAVLGQDEQQLVVDADGLVDARPDFVADLHVLRREPAAHALGLQVGVQAFGEGLVLVE